MNRHHDEEGMLTSSEYNSDTESTQSTSFGGSTQFERRAFSGLLGTSNYAPTTSSNSSCAWQRNKSTKVDNSGGTDKTTGTTSDKNNNDDYVKIALNIRDDSVVVHSVQAAGGASSKDLELALLAKRTAAAPIVRRELRSRNEDRRGRVQRRLVQSHHCHKPHKLRLEEEEKGRWSITKTWSRKTDLSSSRSTSIRST
ncbi:hypothetical protein FF2_037044 [Malus domestica]